MARGRSGLLVGTASGHRRDRRTQLGRAALLVLLPFLMLAACGKPGENDARSASDIALPDPSDGLGSDVSGHYVVGSELYWLAEAQVKPDPADNGFLPSRLLSAVRSFDRNARKWKEAPALPGKPAPKVLASAVADGRLVVVYQDCEAGMIDDDERPRECGGSHLAVLDADRKAWTEVALPGGGRPTQPTISLVAFGANTVLRVESAGKASLWLVNSDSPATANALDTPPALLAGTMPLENACESAAGLQLWAPYFGSANAPTGPATAYPAGTDGPLNPGDVGGVATATLHADSTWSAVSQVDGFVPFPDALGCSDTGVVLKARDARTQSDSRRFVAIEVSPSGEVAELPIRLGADPGLVSTELVGGTKRPPVARTGTSLSVYDPSDTARQVCSTDIPSDASRLYVTDDGVVFASAGTQPGSRGKLSLASGCTSGGAR